MTNLFRLSIACVLVLFTASPVLARQGAMQIGEDEVYIVNTAGSTVSFGLRSQRASEWSLKTLDNGKNDTYGSANAFEFSISTDLKDGKKVVSYLLAGGNRYAIYVNSSYYDIRALAGSKPPVPIAGAQVPGGSNSPPFVR